jgi:hypothetical protein
MAFAFSWETTPLGWPARLGAWDWRSEKYRTPVRCKSGSNCCFDGVCSFVHPGEEGTGLKYFPGRSYVGEDGTECWESAVVRLIGGARYYERRRLRLSWADWCARNGLPLPQRPAPSGRRRERVCLAEPATSGERGDLSSAAPQEQVVSAEEAAAAAAAVQAAVFAQQQEQQRLWLAHQQEQQRLWQAWQAQQQQLWLAQQKQALGDVLFPIVEDALAQSAADRAVIGWDGKLFTAGKFVGMFLEACDLEELQRLTQDSAYLCEMMLEACETLTAAEPVAEVVRPVSVTGCAEMAAAAADTVRELMEDVRRRDAGLPPIDRSGVVSYQSVGDGRVKKVDYRRTAMKNAHASAQRA